MYHSQNDEAEIILEYFGDFTGVLLSIGECDGITFSNSYDLIAKGWQAVLVEPNRRMFNKIQTPLGVWKFNFGIGSTGMQTFHVADDGLLSSTDAANPQRFGVTSYPEEVQFYSYADALAKFPVSKFDFITIDAEGMDWQILQQIDLTDVRCICVEYGKDFDKIVKYAKGFRLLHRNHENVILVR